MGGGKEKTFQPIVRFAKIPLSPPHEGGQRGKKKSSKLYSSKRKGKKSPPETTSKAASKKKKKREGGEFAFTSSKGRETPSEKMKGERGEKEAACP